MNDMSLRIESPMSLYGFIGMNIVMCQILTLVSHYQSMMQYDYTNVIH